MDGYVECTTFHEIAPLTKTGEQARLIRETNVPVETEIVGGYLRLVGITNTRPLLECRHTPSGSTELVCICVFGDGSLE